MPVLAVKDLPQPRQSHLWAPPASRPRLTTQPQPHLGQASGSPARPAWATSDSLIASASCRLSASPRESAS